MLLLGARQSSSSEVYLYIRSHEPHEEVPVGSGIVNHGRVDERRLGVENATHVFWHQVGDSFENSAVRSERRSDFADSIAFQSESDGLFSTLQSASATDRLKHR